MLLLLETAVGVPQGLVGRTGTINLLPLLQGTLLNVCGKPQIFGLQALKPSKMSVFHWWPWCFSGRVQMAGQEPTGDIHLGDC